MQGIYNPLRRQLEQVFTSIIWRKYISENDQSRHTPFKKNEWRTVLVVVIILQHTHKIICILKTSMSIISQ